MNEVFQGSFWTRTSRAHHHCRRRWNSWKFAGGDRRNRLLVISLIASPAGRPVYISNEEVKMWVKSGLVGAALLGLLIGTANLASAQAQTPRRAGGFVPGQQRPPGDPAQIARGKTLYGINCRGCHGADLRGGDMGGPNLLRSPVALSDRDGELIVPIIQGSRKDMGMPAIGLSPEDAKAVAAYVRSVMETIGRQGMPPSVGQEAPSILVGDASEGQAYFAAKCGGCHSPPAICKASRPESPTPRRCRTPG